MLNFLLCSINVSLGRVASCAYPRICSNCAAACFHILGFIARGVLRSWRSSYNRVAHTRVHYLLDCFAASRMTRECGGCGNIFLNSLTTPPLRGTPPTEGNWVWCFLSSRGEQRDRGDPVIIESRIRACIIYWIASLRRA